MLELSEGKEEFMLEKEWGGGVRLSKLFMIQVWEVTLAF
jgi:hypothetical protein